MTAAAVTAPAILAKPGEPECGERALYDGLRCSRPPEHKGGHLDRRSGGRYWQAEEPASVTR
jgi:hypothetical protein